MNSEAESKEVQELFFELGYVWHDTKCKTQMRYVKPVYYSSFDDMELACDVSDVNYKHKEITLPQLRDLVILKRNNRKDANVSDENCLYDLYLTKSKELYFYDCGKNKWILSNLNGDDIYYESLKPIEKKEMKAYLRNNSNNTYSYIGTVRPEHVSNFMIEIPDGTDFVTEHTTGTIHFWRKGSYKTNGNNHDWIDMTCHNEKYDAAYWCEISPSNIIWQRHTLPEELPFIDDEPSLNDQYAEIEKVRQTLNQRQEQYGSFEDVAMITEQMVDVMRKGYYENLAYNQKMALYMICSKMARIVNGNPNHKDSWHDIAGYATLIDNELVSEKDMPF